MNPGDFAKHFKQRTTDLLVDRMVQGIHDKAKSSGAILDVTLDGSPSDVVRKVQSGLRRKGWIIADAHGSKFKVKSIKHSN